MTVPDNVLDAALAMARSLEERAVPYAIGGALALNLYVRPRGTLDVDINVFAGSERWGDVFTALASLGVTFRPEEARADIHRRGMFVAWWGPIKVDVFLPSIPFYDEALRTRVTRDIEGHRYFFLSPEALAVFKLLFFRGKDVLDLEHLLASLGGGLDAPTVRRHIVEMMGEDDERTRKWDALVAAAREGAS